MNLINESLEKMLKATDETKVEKKVVDKTMQKFLRESVKNVNTKNCKNNHEITLAYQRALQEALEKVNPDKCWHEVTKCNIYETLLECKNDTDAVIERILTESKVSGNKIANTSASTRKTLNEGKSVAKKQGKKSLTESTFHNLNGSDYELVDTGYNKYGTKCGLLKEVHKDGSVIWICAYGMPKGDKGEWNQGHYFNKEKEARDYFKKNYSFYGKKEESLTEAPNYELHPQYDSRQSFHGKARVDTGDKNDRNRLYSYDTLVAEIKNGKPVVYGTYSATTLRHIKDWLKQNGFKAETSKQIIADYGVKGESLKENRKEIFDILGIEKENRGKRAYRKLVPQFKKLAKAHGKDSVYLKGDYPVYTDEKEIIDQTDDLISVGESCKGKKCGKKNLKESSKFDTRKWPRYVFTFDDGIQVIAADEEEANAMHQDILDNRHIGAPRSKEELYKIAKQYYDDRDEFSFNYFSDEELAILWSMCMFTEDNRWGCAFDDEVYDTIVNRPNEGEIFARAKRILDNKTESCKGKKLNEDTPKSIMRAYNGKHTDDRMRDLKAAGDNIDFEQAETVELTPEEVLRRKKNGEDLSDIVLEIPAYYGEPSVVELDRQGHPRQFGRDFTNTSLFRANASLKNMLQNASKIYSYKYKTSKETHPERFPDTEDDFYGRSMERQANLELGSTRPETHYKWDRKTRGLSKEKVPDYLEYQYQRSAPRTDKKAAEDAKKAFDDGDISRKEMERRIEDAKASRYVSEYDARNYNKHQNDQANARYFASNKKLTAGVKKFKELKDRLKDLNRNLKNSQNSLEQAKANGGVVVDGNVTYYRDKIKKLQDQIASLQKQIEYYQSEIGDDKAQAEVDNIERRVANYTNDIATAQAEIDKLLKRKTESFRQRKSRKSLKESDEVYVFTQEPDDWCGVDFEDYEGDIVIENGIVIAGNRDFTDFGDKTLIDIVKGDYTDDDLWNEEGGYYEDYDVLDELEKVTGKKYEKGTLRGYSQSDWNNIYYPVDLADWIDEIETFYFGKYDGFDGPDDTLYVVPHDISWKGTEAIKKELADQSGYPADKIKIRKFTGYTRTPNYEDESLKESKHDLYVNGEYICSSNKYKTAKEFKDKVIANKGVEYVGDASGKLIRKDIKDTDKVVVKRDKSRNESLKEKFCKRVQESLKKVNKKNLNESVWSDGQDAYYDLIDRAKGWIDDCDEDDDLSDLISRAIDDGLIYSQDIIGLAAKYGVIDDGELIDKFYEDLFNDIYSEVSDYYDDRIEELKGEEEDEEESLKEGRDEDLDKGIKDEQETIELYGKMGKKDYFNKVEKDQIEEIKGDEKDHKRELEQIKARKLKRVEESKSAEEVDKEADSIEKRNDEDAKELTEDTVKQGSQWVNKGKEGTHGKFKTKKAADAQRRAMFATRKPGASWGK